MCHMSQLRLESKENRAEILEYPIIKPLMKDVCFIFLLKMAHKILLRLIEKVANFILDKKLITAL